MVEVLITVDVVKEVATEAASIEVTATATPITAVPTVQPLSQTSETSHQHQVTVPVLLPPKVSSTLESLNSPTSHQDPEPSFQETMKLNILFDNADRITMGFTTKLLTVTANLKLKMTSGNFVKKSLKNILLMTKLMMTTLEKPTNPQQDSME